MAECFIVRRGGQSYQLPVLHSSYPQDATVVASASGSASFTVQISQPGTPAEYTYQWYKNGSAIASATGSSVTISGLTSAASHTVYCEVTNKAGTVTSRVATLTVQDWKPVYTYTGTSSLIDDGSYHWRIKFLSSGTLTFTSLGNTSSIDVFCVGGGAGAMARNNANYCGGGGGGYTTTGKSIVVSTGTSYAITVGAGGAPYSSSARGGTSSAFNISAQGGYSFTGGGYINGGNGGSGGGGGGWGSWVDSGAGGSDGSDGGNGRGGDGGGYGGTGQGSTTREFGESTGTLYAGGGGGSGTGSGGGGGAGGGGGYGAAGTTNTGGGASGNYYGGSGIVVIRNHR